MEPSSDKPADPDVPYYPRMMMNLDPPKLDYATRVGEYPDPKAHSGLAVFLIGTTSLAGFATIILGLCYVVDFRLYAALLIAGGCGYCWATLGYLPAGHPKFRTALILLTLALICQGVVVRLSHLDLVAVEAQYGPLRATESVATDAAYHVEIIRNCAALSAAIGAVLWLYVIVRLVRDRTQ